MTSSLKQNDGAMASEDVKLKYIEILKANGITDEVSEVIVKDAGLKGEGMASETLCVTVKFKNPDLKQLNLFAKVHINNPSSIAMVEDLKLFEKEAKFLGEYVPAAVEFCTRKGLPQGFIDFYPKLYHGDEKLVVLEHLSLDKGYVLVDKEEKQDFHAAKLSITTLAKHHSISYAMIREHGGPEKFFQRFKNLDYEISTRPSYKDVMSDPVINSMKTNIQLLEKYKVDGSEQAVADLKSVLSKDPLNILLNVINAPVDEASLMVLNHGDYWSNNMMFQKDPRTTRLIHHVAIDFQLTSYNSLVLDLEYFLFTSVQPGVRQMYIQDLLELYVDTFNDLGSSLGHQAKLTFDQVYLEFRRKVDYGFCIGNIFSCAPAIGIMNSVDLTKVDMSDFAQVFGDLLQKWLEENPEEAIEICNEIVTGMHEYRHLVLDG